MERRQDDAITVVVEVAGVLDAGGVKDGHRILLDTAVRGGGGGGGWRARGRHSADAKVWEGFFEVMFFSGNTICMYCLDKERYTNKDIQTPTKRIQKQPNFTKNPK